MTRPILPALIAGATLLASPALADDATGVSGTWSGTYACGKVVRAMTVTLTGDADGAISGELAFGPGPKGESASGRFHVSGGSTTACCGFAATPGLSIRPATK